MEKTSRNRPNRAPPASILFRTPIVVLGLLIASTGVSFYLKSGLGVDAFSVFCGGLAKLLHISFGLALQISSFFLIAIIAVIDRSLLGIGTVMHALLMGVFIDVITRLGLIQSSGAPLQSIFYVGIGVLLVGFGLAIYIKAGIGSGALDATMFLLHKKSRIELRWIKIGLDFFLACFGYLLGGALGITTLVTVLLTGPIIQRSMWMIESIHKSGNRKI
jgi:uncharacterized membrane protein YczE